MCLHVLTNATPITNPHFDFTGDFCLATEEKICKIWDVITGKQLFSFTDAQSKITSACYNLTGTKIVIGTENGVARIYDSYEGTLLKELKGENQDEGNIIHSC
jgi:WD40 repeat protein